MSVYTGEQTQGRDTEASGRWCLALLLLREPHQRTLRFLGGASPEAGPSPKAPVLRADPSYNQHESSKGATWGPPAPIPLPSPCTPPTPSGVSLRLWKQHPPSPQIGHQGLREGSESGSGSGSRPSLGLEDGHAGCARRRLDLTLGRRTRFRKDIRGSSICSGQRVSAADCLGLGSSSRSFSPFLLPLLP